MERKKKKENTGRRLNAVCGMNERETLMRIARAERRDGAGKRKQEEERRMKEEFVEGWNEGKKRRKTKGEKNKWWEQEASEWDAKRVEKKKENEANLEAKFVKEKRRK